MVAEEEKLYEELRRLGQRLHIPISETFWELEVRDRSGKVVQRLRQRSHSWVRNAYNMMFCYLAGKDLSNGSFGAGYLSLKETGGAVQNGAGPVCLSQGSSVDSTSMGYRGPAGNDAYGILVGSGTNPEDFESHALHVKIANGTGAGQLTYVQSESHAINWNPGTLTMKNDLARFFNNNSGADVSVNEVALALRGYRPGSSVPYHFMTARDLLIATVTVPNTGQLKVTYTVQLSYPA
ncbi:MAG: hypothetical protein QQM50_06380 [Dehalococcoides mccartyi]|uniref:hypothetical protein n=1 Tax=Dehalococcoides TaxID=61434 RepID=UPI002737C934|nr:hypothetical protein [Dehalococcoides mccartyi]MDP4280155.1 hypothetical protein [Dehalococcoides mccartyi]